MAGRPKIQFTENDGNRAWELLEKIIDHRHREDQKDFKEKLANIRDEFPDAKLKGNIPKPSAGKIVLDLLEAEAQRISEE